MKTFLGMCLRGEARPQDIDYYVRKYFSKEYDCFTCLRDFLGLTESEYYTWANNVDTFDSIVKHHRKVAMA